VKPHEKTKMGRFQKWVGRIFPAVALLWLAFGVLTLVFLPASHAGTGVLWLFDAVMFFGLGLWNRWLYRENLELDRQAAERERRWADRRQRAREAGLY
jgi:hypothetical protein